MGWMEGINIDIAADEEEEELSHLIENYGTLTLEQVAMGKNLHSNAEPSITRHLHALSVPYVVSNTCGKQENHDMG